MDIKGQLIQEVEGSNYQQVKQILMEYDDLDLMQIEDQQLQTCLHLTCLAGDLDIFNLIINYVDTQIKMKLQFTNQNYMVNFMEKRNEEGFTAVHLASFSGSLEMVEYMVKRAGVQILDKKNVNQLKPIHTAAQGDSHVILAYLKEMGQDIEQVDDSGRTPLHWATYQGSENAACFLLAWDAQFDSPDNLTGMTPLHLAAISGSVRLVKKLLLRGANKMAKDEQGMTPLDIAKSNEFKTITEMLSDYNKISKCLGLKQELKQPKDYPSQFIAFIVLQFSTALLTFLFVMPYIKSDFIVYGFFAIQFFIPVFMFFVKLNPGYLKPQKKIVYKRKYYKILNKIKKIEDYCPDCQIMKPKRSRHCDICKSCIKVYDHHCPWINNCVGAKNYKWFLSMIILVFIGMIYQIMIQIMYFNSDTLNQNMVIFGINHYNDGSILQHMHRISSVIVIIICSIFFFHLGALLFFQIGNVFSGKTTNEKFSHKNKKKPTLDKVTIGNEENENEDDSEKQSDSNYDSDYDSETQAQTMEDQQDSQQIQFNGKINSVSSSFMSQNEEDAQKKSLNENFILKQKEEEQIQNDIINKQLYKDNKAKLAKQGDFWWTKQSCFSNCADMCFNNANNNEWGILQK